MPGEFSTRLGQSALTGKPDIAAALQSRIGRGMVGALAAPLATAPLNLLISQGDPDQFGQLSGSAAAIGGMSGASGFRFRPEILANADAALQKQGAAPTGNKPLDAMHAQGMAVMSPADQSQLNVMRGMFQSMPIDTGTGKKAGANIYALTPEDFASELKRRGVPSELWNLAEQEGYYDDKTGEALVNAGRGAPGYTGAHEAGHIGEQVLELMGKNGNPLHQNMMDTLQNGLIEGGQPTRLFRRFIDQYKTGATPEIQSLPDSDPYWQREFLAKTVSDIIAKERCRGIRRSARALRSSAFERRKDVGQAHRNRGDIFDARRRQRKGDQRGWSEHAAHAGRGEVSDRIRGFAARGRADSAGWSAGTGEGSG